MTKYEKNNDFFKKSVSRLLSILLIIMIGCSCFGGCVVLADETEISSGTRYVPNREVGYGLELLPETEVFENIDTFDSSTLVSPSDKAALPVRVDLSEDKYFPQIGNQGTIGSCTSWACGYYQYSYQRARLNNWNLKEQGSDEFIASPKYIYNFLSEGSNSRGTPIEGNYYLLMTQGCVSLEDFPYSDSQSWYYGDTETETIDALHNALSTTITSYEKHRFDNNFSYPVVTSSDDDDLYNLKSLINTGHCLVFPTYIDNFRTSTLENGEVICFNMENGSREGHAMTIVGYDDTIWFNLNGDDKADNFEYGAFKIVNSWGTEYDLVDKDGFLWVAYDVLNDISNYDQFNSNYRGSLFVDDSYYSIEVANSSPKLTVEITVEQSRRNGFSVALGRSDTVTSPKETISFANINKASGDIGFDGITNEPQIRTLVLDYSSCVEELTSREKVDLYAGGGKVYWVDIKDETRNDGANTIVKKICWKDENKNIIREIIPNETLNGNTGSYWLPLENHVQLRFNKDTSYLCVDEHEQLITEIIPAYIGETDISWTSSNEEVVTVSALGEVIGIDYGSAVITATAEEYGISASCLVQVVHPVENIIIDHGGINIINLGENDFLSVDIYPTNAEIRDVIWTSSDSGVVSVSETGVVTATGYGFATITATAADGKGAVASCMYMISDDYYDYAAKAKHVNEDEGCLGDINYSGDGDYFLFTPEVSSVYTIYTSGSVNTKLFLYDGQENQLVSNDDWENGNTTSLGIQYFLIAGENYYIRVTSDDGTTTGWYTLMVDDDHIDAAFGATSIEINSSTSGTLNNSEDVDYFKFTPTESGTYLFYTTGNTDTYGELHKRRGGTMISNDDGGISDTNFALVYQLDEGETYYLMLKTKNSDTGAYTLFVTKAFHFANYVNTNVDARKVQMVAEASSVLTNLTVIINNTSYLLTKPISGNLDTTVNGVRFKVTFTSENSGLSTLWNITANIPATAVGSTTTTKFTFSEGSIADVSSSNLTGLIAYGSSYKTNLMPNTYLSTVINDMETAGYTFTAYDWNNMEIDADTTKVATGQRIVQTNLNDDIVHVYYLVLYGDVAGSGIVGDGLINANDALEVLKEVEETFLGVISKLAADADHDDNITEDDAELILQHSVATATINQNIAITQAVDSSCYYETSVVF